VRRYFHRQQRTSAMLLSVSRGRMEDVTMVVVPRGDKGFYILADQYSPGAMGNGPGEFLLDHACGGEGGGRAVLLRRQLEPLDLTRELEA
jgi:hypothetical protein